MGNLKEQAMALLSRTVVLDVQSDGPTLNQLYTVPPGKRAVIAEVVLHSPTASLAGMDDVDFGGGVIATAPDWVQNETGIGAMTAVDDYMNIRGDSNEYGAIDGDDAQLANRTFSMYVVSGSTGVAGVTVDVFGYLIDS